MRRGYFQVTITRTQTFFVEAETAEDAEQLLSDSYEHERVLDQLDNITQESVEWGERQEIEAVDPEVDYILHEDEDEDGDTYIKLT